MSIIIWKYYQLAYSNVASMLVSYSITQTRAADTGDRVWKSEVGYNKT